MQKERQFEKIIKEICAENGYSVTFFCDGWITLIDNGQKRMLIHGYKFPNNSGAIEQLCDDKSGMCELLKNFGIPCVEHEYMFVSENNVDYQHALSLLQKYKALVVKPNNGTGGTNVYKVTTPKKLVEVLNKMSLATNMVAISPYLQIEAEYRSVILGSQMLFTFEKIRPTVIADGKKCMADYLPYQDLSDDLKNQIPTKGTPILLNWKHNLQGGAKPNLVKNVHPEMIGIVNKIYQDIGVNFASVDIVKVDGKFYVLEINSGVMTECFSSCSCENYQLAKNAYCKAIKEYFAN